MIYMFLLHSYSPGQLQFHPCRLTRIWLHQLQSTHLVASSSKFSHISKHTRNMFPIDDWLSIICKSQLVQLVGCHSLSLPAQVELQILLNISTRRA